MTIDPEVVADFEKLLVGVTREEFGKILAHMKPENAALARRLLFKIYARRAGT